MKLKQHLASAGSTYFSAYCIVAAFGTYFCMYAFRKPFTAATYDGIELLGIGYKTVLVISQVLGYTISKFLGIKFVSEAEPHRRSIMILMLIGIAQAALLLFAIVPPPYNFVCLFINGLPLGMVFGLVLGFLEGRKMTELLTAGLCASFILSGGAVKSVGQWLILQDITDFWMPFLTGLIFVPVLLLSVWMLHQIPPPDTEDQTLRSQRAPSRKEDRRIVMAKHGMGLTMLVFSYMLLTVIRSLRDDFGVEIWSQLGFNEKPEVFTQSELIVTWIVVIVNGAVFLVKDNRTAFYTAITAIGAGFALTLLAVFLFWQRMLGPFAFMVTAGVGLYVPYVAYHTTLFERMIAVFRERTNLAHLMYLADSFGYLGYVLVLLIRNFAKWEINYLNLFLGCLICIGCVALLLTVYSFFYFRRQIVAHQQATAVQLSSNSV
ncbi:MAG: hypothetical protein KDA87_10930 [Planctomycetales bacterium]|nr:hypothetical protein [Planctomycetales bacterium]